MKILKSTLQGRMTGVNISRVILQVSIDLLGVLAESVLCISQILALGQKFVHNSAMSTTITAREF